MSDPIIEWAQQQFGIAFTEIQPGFNGELAKEGLLQFQQLSYELFNPELVGHTVNHQTIQALADNIITNYEQNVGVGPMSIYQNNDNAQFLPTFKLDMQHLVDEHDKPIITTDAPEILQHAEVQWLNAFWVLGPIHGWNL